MIARTSVPNRSALGSSRQGPTRSITAAQYGSTRRRCAIASAQGSRCLRARVMAPMLTYDTTNPPLAQAPGLGRIGFDRKPGMSRGVLVLRDQPGVVRGQLHAELRLGRGIPGRSGASSPRRKPRSRRAALSLEPMLFSKHRRAPGVELRQLPEPVGSLARNPDRSVRSDQDREAHRKHDGSASCPARRHGLVPARAGSLRDRQPQGASTKVSAARASLAERCPRHYR